MTRFFRRVLRWIDRHLLSALLGFIGVGMVAVVLWPYSVIDIPAGFKGVRWSRFGGGTVMTEVYDEGIRFIAPWDKMYLYDTRLQRMTQTLTILAKDSLRVTVSLDFMYRPNADFLPFIHRYVGPDYALTVLAPVVGAETRNAFATFNVDTGLTKDRGDIALQIEDKTNKYLLDRFNPPDDGTPVQYKYISLDSVLINEITLPPEVAAAIADKDTVRERSEAYTFRLEMEKHEAERKAIEAKGIKDFYDTVGNALTDNYLKLRTIEALLELSKSPNAKVVVLGGSPNNMPLVLGADGTPLVPATPAPGARPSGTTPPPTTAPAAAGPPAAPPK